MFDTIDLFPLIGYFSFFLAISGYRTMHRHLQEQQIRERNLLLAFSNLKGDLMTLEKKLVRSSPAALVAHQDECGVVVKQTQDTLEQVKNVTSDNTRRVADLEGQWKNCQQKIKGLEQGLSLVNSILEASATSEKVKSGFSLW